MRQHDRHCGCEGHHQGCGHEHHHHEHGEHCGCGHSHAPIAAPEGLSSVQVDILLALRQRKCLPVACFLFAKSGDAARHAIALAPVYLGTPKDSMEQVKQLGNELLRLENMDLVTLDYDIPLKEYSYEEYKTSDLYAYFMETMEEAARLPNPTFDMPKLELGSMALTEAGEDMADGLLKTDPNML